MGIVMNLYARVSMWLVSDMGEEEIKPPTDVEEEELIDIIEAGEKEGLDKVSVPLALLKRALWYFKSEHLRANALELKLQTETAVVRARNQGVGSFMSGQPVTTNPHTDPKLKMVWAYGWEAAQAVKRNTELEIEIMELRKALAAVATKEGVG